jgi:hypothetical protein
VAGRLCVLREHAFTRTASEKQAAVASVHIGCSAFGY